MTMIHAKIPVTPEKIMEENKRFFAYLGTTFFQSGLILAVFLAWFILIGLVAVAFLFFGESS